MAAKGVLLAGLGALGIAMLVEGARSKQTTRNLPPLPPPTPPPPPPPPPPPVPSPSPAPTPSPAPAPSSPTPILTHNPDLSSLAFYPAPAAHPFFPTPPCKFSDVPDNLSATNIIRVVALNRGLSVPSDFPTSRDAALYVFALGQSNSDKGLLQGLSDSLNLIGAKSSASCVRSWANTL